MNTHTQNLINQIVNGKFGSVFDTTKTKCCANPAERKDVVREYNVAGYNRNEIQVSTDNDVVNIVADSAKYGKRSDSFFVGYNVSEKNVKATLVNGILTVTITCPDEEKPRVIPIG